MNKNTLWKKLVPLLLVLVLLLAACDTDDNTNQPGPTDTGVNTTMNEQSLDSWLQQVNNDQIESKPIGQMLDWSKGYLVYYGTLESIGIDNMIYNALEVHRRLDTGEVTRQNLSDSEQNLLDITEGIEYDSEADLTDQVAQTPEIRRAIMEHIVQSQTDLTPQEALDSNNIIGVFGPPAPQSIGSKYLVYTQDSPDAEYNFLGVILAVDATTQANTEPYSVGEWDNLPLLGDAAGPFWNDLPAGVSGDPTNTAEGRPGVLLVSEATFAELTSQAMR